MATQELVTKVWIAPGCIVCDACETACPEVFEVKEETCIVRPEALDAEFCKPLTASIIQAAEECPVEVIKFETVEAAAGAAAAAAPQPAAVAAAAPARTAKAHADQAREAAPSKSPEAPAKPAAEAAPKEKPPREPMPAGATDPAIQALIRAATARGGKAGMALARSGSATAIKELRAKPVSDLPPDARYARVLEKSKTSPEKKESISRRGFLSALGIGWTAFAASTAASVVAFQRFMFPNVLEEPDPKIRCGPVETYAMMPTDGVNEDFKPKGIWIIRLDDRLAALSTTCTHLGCIPNWLEADRKFKCPCHGSGFKQNGINFEGPAPRPLERYKVGLDGGMLVVDKSKKFQQEKGEWVHPDSYVLV